MTVGKIGSLFDGSGGFPLAGYKNGFTPVWASEVEPYPIRVTKERFPGMQHLGSVTEVNGAEIEPVDVITFGSPCFPAGTLVSTSIGLKPIEEVNVGDMVLTHKARFRQVVDAAYTGTKTLFELNAMGVGSIKATPNHLFYVRKKIRVWDPKQKTNVRKFLQPEWVEMRNIQRGDYLCIPLNTKEENLLQLSLEECYLVGRYIADGHIRDEQRPDRPAGSKFHSVVFSIGKEKAEDFISCVKNHKYSISDEGSVLRFSIHENRLEKICSLCGKGAGNKEIPTILLNLDTTHLKRLLDGYMAGDGCFTGGKFKAATISKKLAHSFVQAVGKVYHVPCSLYKIVPPEKKKIGDRIVNQRPWYQMSFKKEPCKQDKAFWEDGFVWVPVNSVQATSEKKAVYDLSVYEDHSFCVSNVAVHNCQDLSIAGKQKGIHDGARSSLFFQAVRIIKEMRENDRANGRANEHIRPRFAVWENVPGAYSSNGGRDFQAVLQALCEIADPAVSIPFPQKGKWANAGCIVGDGYSIAWRTYDAQYWPRTPQRRKRIYLIADFASERAGEILFERESVPGYPEPGEKAGQGIAADAERSAGGSDQAGGMISAFMGGQGAKARSIAYCDDGTVPTLKASNSGGNQVPDVVYSIEGNIVDRSSAKNGKGWSENQSPTLNTVDRHAVCYPNTARTLTARFDSSPCIDRGGEVVCYGIEGDGNVRAHIGDNVSPCMKTIHPNCVCYDTTQITSPDNYSNPKMDDPCHPLASNQHPPLLVFDCRGNGGV